MYAEHSVEMFRQKFWGTLLLSIPTLAWAPMMQHWFGYTAPGGATASRWIPAIFGSLVFAYGGWVFVKAAAGDLRTGDLVLVRPGASVPVDGVVREGSTDVNESLITGESRPVRKEPDAKVIAGTLNGAGSLRVEVTGTGDRTALAGIMRLVAQAQSSRSRAQALADRPLSG